MSLAWTINRLRSMSPAEILHRVGEKHRKSISRRRHQGWSRYPARPLHPVWQHLATRMLQATPEQRTAIASAAERFLSGGFSGLGRTWPQTFVAPPYDALWRLDPVTGAAWPDSDTYAFNVDFRHDGSRGDVKYVWEVNRLQMLPVLAAHVVLTGDQSSLAGIEAIIESWHRTNPPFGGVGWASGIEVALRAISLLATLDLVGTKLCAATRGRISQILCASAFWLPRFPSLHSSANNHLVAELAAEVLLARSLGESQTAARQRLLGELSKQILVDGAGAEQSPTYAAFSAELMLLAAEAARQAGTPFPPSALARLAGFATFTDWIGPQGRFGDDDEGRALAIGPEVDYAGSVASAIRGLLGTPAVRAHADFRSLFFPAPPAGVAEPEGLHIFEQGGLSVWRGELGSHKATLRFDHGPLGYLSIAAHGHADALAVSLDVDGQPVLVDPGTYLYGSGGPWRDWFRSTPAHNTLNLESHSQSMISGAFNWSHKAASRLVEQASGFSRRLVAEHDGYLSRFGAVHRRSVSMSDREIVVHDCLTRGPAREAEIVWQFAPDTLVIIKGQRILCTLGAVRLEFDLPDGAVTLACGEDGFDGGWVSPAFGVLVPAPRLVWRGLVDTAGVRTRIGVRTLTKRSLLPPPGVADPVYSED